jgi:hypothetical protein
LGRHSLIQRSPGYVTADQNTSWHTTLSTPNGTIISHVPELRLQHTTLATARLRFPFLAAKIWRHAGRVGVSYSGHYAEQGIFRRLMDRLRAIENEGQRFRPVLATALRE